MKQICGAARFLSGACVAVALVGSARDAHGQHVTAEAAATIGMETGPAGCDVRAREAATLLDALNVTVDRARRSNDEAAMRAATTAAQAGFADVRSRLQACRPAAAVPPATAAGSTPAKPDGAGVDHAAMGHAAPAAAAAAPTPLRQVEGAAEAALQSFQDALQVGNRDVALHWLAPDVTIAESGVTDASRDAYAARHMALDMTFLKTATIVLLDRQGHAADDSTHIVSTSRITGRAGEIPVVVTVTEGALLRKTPQGWRIASIEWSAVTHRDHGQGSSTVGPAIPPSAGHRPYGRRSRS
ncbi:MAG TPA: nuclear transport factor 2 family protein [Vicinamibacterales bacterium]|nr:nuclear transport factor 2 family protein [Vicinamibacterales bacterium]